MVGKKSSFKFSKKYSLFLSEASNGEIVAISKELSGEMAAQTRLLNITAVALLAVASTALLIGVFLVSQVDAPISKFNTIMTFCRFGALTLMCIGAGLAAMAVNKAIKASSMSTLMWRNVRETPSDEAAYEQTKAITQLNRLLFTGRNDINMSSMMIALGSILLATTFAVGLLADMGYL